MVRVGEMSQRGFSQIEVVIFITIALAVLLWIYFFSQLTTELEKFDSQDAGKSIGLFLGGIQEGMSTTAAKENK